ncbi:glycoside hydrolase family 125 protein [Promicromonospora sp. NPDC090134]|uniref:glycoside hydrolase family 125 protein n=1 Tax=Promicromonospora sp. NPDC090134 TaxID=3364408 RepID=UPI003800AB95
MSYVTGSAAPASGTALYDPEVLADLVARVGERLGSEVADAVGRCMADTLARTITPHPDGTAFVITGDIPAMWLRDSTTQLAPFLHLVDRDERLADTIAAVSRRQQASILRDPYANAFNDGPTGAGHRDRTGGPGADGPGTGQSPWVWERKYEIDSLAYPLQLAHDLWRATGRTDHLADLGQVGRTVIELWRTEQRHEEASSYTFERTDCPPTDTLVRGGRGPEVAWTGMTWAGFRPSDDACAYGYNVPGNALAAAALGQLAELATEVLHDADLAASATALRAEIERGIREHGVVPGPDGVPVYAYEVDGRGGVLLADDANTPSLLALPLTGWCRADDPLYTATRDLVLSPANPYYYSGSAASGIGSPHTPEGHVWPIALAIQGLTSTDPAERRALLDLILATDDGTGAVHESFHVDDPGTWTREWFSWANAMFCELALETAGLRTHRRPAPEPAP